MSKTAFSLLLIGLPSVPAAAQKAPGSSADSVLITIFLKHQQDKSLRQQQEIQERNNFPARFPPKETRVVSWTC